MTPCRDQYQDNAQCSKLSDFDADIKGNQIGQQSVFGNMKFLQLGRQTKTMKQAENQYGVTCVRLKPQHPLKATQVVEAFLHNRKADDGINQVSVNLNIGQHARHQGNAVSQSKQTDVEEHFPAAEQKEDYP